MRLPVNGKYFISGDDAGHGKVIAGDYDSGAVGQAGTRESDITMPIMLFYEERMKQRLGEKIGFVRGREPGVTESVSGLNADLASRYNKFDRAGCDWTVSFHVDCTDDPRPARITSYIFATGGEAEKIAKKVQPKMCAAVPFELYGLEDGGVRTANFAMVREPDAPSILVEMGFISNSGEEQELRKPAIQKALGYAIADGILEWLGAPAAVEKVSGVTVVLAREQSVIPGVVMGERVYILASDVATALKRVTEWDYRSQTVTIK